MSVDRQFLHAVENGDLEQVKEALGKGADVDVTDNIGQTALMAASRKGHKAMVKLLLDKGADVNAKTKMYGWTALKAAAMEGHEEIVEVLKKHGAKD